MLEIHHPDILPATEWEYMRIHTLSTSWANLLVVLLLELPSLQEESNQCRADGSEQILAIWG